jgi:hypothetical protein
MYSTRPVAYAQAAMPTPDEFSRWLQGYRDEFTDLDAESAGELFSDEAMYYESPFAPPIHGRSNIRRVLADRGRCQCVISSSDSRFSPRPTISA